jgi:2-oxoglutarate ferredoxin oxidoreductase subunit beta
LLGAWSLLADEPKAPKAWRSETKPHRFCPGCGHGIILKGLADVVDELGIHRQGVFACDIGCSLLSWDFFNLDSVQTHHGRTIPVVVGMKRVRPDYVVVAYVGDGGGYSIGLQHLISSAVRNDPVTVILVNNTVYAMTGGQMAPTTLPGQKTSTTPYGRSVEDAGSPFMGPEIVAAAASDRAYVARGSMTRFSELKQILKKALLNQIQRSSFSFVEFLSSCPTNWRTKPSDTLKFVNEDMATVFPLKEHRVPEGLGASGG